MARRPFIHLSQAEIRDIISSHFSGESQTSIASRLSIDHTTVQYHLRKYDRAYIEEASVYAMVKFDMRRECRHPSLKCLLCGKAHDRIQSVEMERLNALETENARLRERLVDLGQVV